MPGHKCVRAPLVPKIPEPKLYQGSDAQIAAARLLEGPARYVCLAGGTRSGKTFLIVRAIVARAVQAPESRHAILRLHANAARASIARDTLPKVMKTFFPGVQLIERRQESVFVMKNDARITVEGLDDDARVEKILGHEFASIFLNEASQIPFESALVAFTRLAQVVPDLMQRAYVDLNPTVTSHWTNLLFGEKRDPVSRQPLADPDAYARAFLNPRDNAANLTPDYLASLATLPERQRRRFYEGVYVDSLDGALWNYELIDKNRADPEMIEGDQRKLVVIGVDPAGSGRKSSDATGIVVAALDPIGDAYVLDDLSCRDEPLNWARRAVAAYHDYKAGCLVVETNFGGDMVPAMIAAVDPNVRVKKVQASQGKAARASPIAMRYERGQVHHIKRFAKLEEELCAFTLSGYMGAGSPDHADAAIWALTFLFDQGKQPGVLGYYEKLK